MAPADDIAQLLQRHDASQAELDAAAAALASDTAALMRALPPLAAALAASHASPAAAANAAAVVAAACKADDAREAAGREADGALVAALVQALRHAAGQPQQPATAGEAEAEAGPAAPPLLLLRTQVLRALGNLCYEHEDNRRRVRSAGGVAALGAALAAMTVSGDDDGGDEAGLDDGPPRMAHLAGAGAVLNSSGGEDEELKKELVEVGVVESLVWLLRRARAGGERHMALCALARFSGLDAAVDRMGPALPALIEALAEAEGEAEEHTEVTELLRATVRSDKAVAHLAQRERLARLEGLAEDASRPPFVRHQTAVLLSVALGDDACQALLWTPEDGPESAVVARLVAWTRSSDHEMQVAGAVGLGNLCRSDVSAAALGRVEGLLGGLLGLLESNLSFVQHAALGAVRNLGRLPANQPAFVTRDGLRQLSVTLQDPQAPLQYATCSILRTLCASSDKAVTDALLPRMLGSEDDAFLPRLLHLSRSEELAVRAEASRALAAAVRAAAAADRLAPFVEGGGATTLVRMLEEAHPLLRQEGTVALAILAACGGNCAQAVVQAQGMQALLKRMDEPLGPTHPPEALCNELSLAQQLLQATANGAAAGAAPSGEGAEVTTAGAAADGAADVAQTRTTLLEKVRALAREAPTPLVQQHAAKMAAPF